MSCAAFVLLVSPSNLLKILLIGIYDECRNSVESAQGGCYRSFFKRQRSGCLKPSIMFFGRLRSPKPLPNRGKKKRVTIAQPPLGRRNRIPQKKSVLEFAQGGGYDRFCFPSLFFLATVKRCAIIEKTSDIIFSEVQSFKAILGLLAGTLEIISCC